MKLELWASLYSENNFSFPFGIGSRYPFDIKNWYFFFVFHIQVNYYYIN